MTHLMIHQKEGIQFLLDTPRALLADEAGLGKTRQVLEAAKQFIKGRDLLVLCPTSIIENWKIESKLWDFPQNKITVVGYEYQFLHDIKTLLRRRWGVIVADEAHFLRNWEAQRTKLFHALIKGRDSKIWFLSGTPMVKGAMDLHPMLSIMEPGKWGKFKDFCADYCKVKPNQWKPGGIEYYGVKNVRVLSAAVSKLMLRRYKAEVVEDMPPKLVSEIPLILPQGQFDIFTSDGLVRAVAKAAEDGTAPKDVEVCETIRELGLKKVDHVVKFIEDTLHPHPIVIFAHHRMVLYDLAEKLRDKGRRVEVLIGGMDKAVRQNYVNMFQKGELDDLVVGIGVGGLGINLFRSSRCVFAEFPWTWAALDQASDRLHRIGQTDCVNAYHCYAKGTFEERQLRVIEERKIMTKEVIDV